MEIYKIFVKASVKNLRIFDSKALFVDSHKLCRHIRAVFGACSFFFYEIPVAFYRAYGGRNDFEFVIVCKKAFWA